VELPRPAIDLSQPPPAIGELVEWFEAMSTGLVLLEPYPVSEVRGAIARFHATVRDHSEVEEARFAGEPPRTDPIGNALTELVRSDHRWFEVSFEQLDWLLRIVEENGHGGNRQALGQYGRLVAEAVRRHLADERRLAPGRPISSEKP